MKKVVYYMYDSSHADFFLSSFQPSDLLYWWFFWTFTFSDQTKLIDLEEMAKTMNKGKWNEDASQVIIGTFFLQDVTLTVYCS